MRGVPPTGWQDGTVTVPGDREAGRLAFDEIEVLQDISDVLPGPAGDEVWLGDDAAVLRFGSTGRGGGIGEDREMFKTGSSAAVVASVDLTVEGRHFDLSFSALEDAGWKALMRAASDLAAMGAIPARSLAGLVLDRPLDVKALYAGMTAAAGRIGCPVVGGDVSAGEQLVLAVTVLGIIEEGPGPVLRTGARPGDYLLLTGPVGGAAAGLRTLRASAGRGIGAAGSAGASAGGFDLPHGLLQVLAERCLRPVALVEQGRLARLVGAHAMIDVSDGFERDLRRLLEASGVGCELGMIPVAEGADLADALYGGDDYELIIAMDDPVALSEAAARAGFPRPIQVGRCNASSGELLLNGEIVTPGGHVHRFG